MRPFSGSFLMEIKVSEIPSEGQTIELSEEVGVFEGLVEEARVTGTTAARLHLRKVGATVYLTGEMDTEVELDCSRCGKPYTFRMVVGIDLDINPAAAAAVEQEKELHAEDMEVEYYRDDVIDLTEFLKEQVLLNLPMKPLCDEGCRGLCQYCGKDLNEGGCSCEVPTGHPGLAGLKDMLKDKG